MKINTSEKIKLLDGSEITKPDKTNFTIKDVLINCLGVHQTNNGEEAIKTYDLGLRIYNSKGEIDLKDDEVKFLKSVISGNKQFVAIVTAQVLKYLEKIDN